MKKEIRVPRIIANEGCARLGCLFLVGVAAGHIIFKVTDVDFPDMTDEEQDENTQPESSPFTGRNLNRILAILFVLGIYLIIFLKITLLK